MELPQQGRVGLLCPSEESLEFLVTLLETLDLLSLSLPGGLGGAAVSENALDTALFLLVLGLGPFPAGMLVMQRAVRHRRTSYLGGRFVLGSGNT